MSNQLGRKPVRVVSVALQETDAIRLHAHRKEYKHAMPVIVMAGVTALEEGASPEYSWFNRLMGATCRYSLGGMIAVEATGLYIDVREGGRFETFPYFDSSAVRHNSNGVAGRTIYAGTRHNCELVAAHLNKILREAEEEVAE